MSQTYRCQLKASVQETVHIGDTIRHRLSLTEILPADEMAALLRQALADAGFRQAGEDRWVLSEAGAETVVDLGEMSVVTEASADKALQAEATATGVGWNRDQAQASARQQLDSARQATAERLQAEGRKLQVELSDTLAAADAAHMELLHIVLQEVYAESLKQKARQMGDVVEVTEGTSPSGEYELVIKVET